jgi:ApaG protein
VCARRHHPQERREQDEQERGRAAEAYAILNRMSVALTQGIRVEVKSTYVAERSAPGDAYFFFAYHVRISNQGVEPAQLLSRRWIITDAEGRQELVEGPGVVGEQPILAPGEEYEYTSYCPLPTSVGAMQGAYQMVTKSGQQFEAEIAPFTLAVPFAVN